jgi:hypothetical protein
MIGVEVIPEDDVSTLYIFLGPAALIGVASRAMIPWIRG